MDGVWETVTPAQVLDARAARVPTGRCGARSVRRSARRARRAAPRIARAGRARRVRRPRGPPPVRRPRGARLGPTNRTSCCGTRRRCCASTAATVTSRLLRAEGLSGIEALVDPRRDRRHPRHRVAVEPRLARRRLGRGGRAPAGARLPRRRRTVHSTRAVRIASTSSSRPTCSRWPRTPASPTTMPSGSCSSVGASAGW